jgi:hypothetical protein
VDRGSRRETVIVGPKGQPVNPVWIIVGISIAMIVVLAVYSGRRRSGKRDDAG